MVASGRRQLQPTPALDLALLRLAFRDAGVKDLHISKVWSYVIGSTDDLNFPEVGWNTLEASKSGLPLAALEALKRGFVTCSSKVQRWQSENERGSGKLIIELQDGQCIETVIIEHGGPRPRSTICVSSQVGCKMGCQFCATGTMGLRAHLSAGEILEQLLHARRRVRPEAPVRNVVFMGMGEPLDNYQQVLGALQVMSDAKGFGLSPRNITVSTVGVPGKIAQLGTDCPTVHLALSLHAPLQELRARIVPSAKGYSLDRLMDEVDEYGARTGNKVMMEYVLIEGTNASEAEAHELGALLACRRALIMLNLIPYNPTTVGTENGFRSPSDETCKRFRDIVASYRRSVDAPGCSGILDAKAGAPILSTVRWSTVPGQSNDAACGQLALETPGEVQKKAGGSIRDIEDHGSRAEGAAAAARPAPGFAAGLPGSQWQHLLALATLALATLGAAVALKAHRRADARLH
eukprot:TRINITY_DN91437_c0_g1_i1.p1 TRINITY_DN91437_c0_g1~~TRINITY_DN91437_c0_g1_i1.p1  ORF type:complete len:473 (+),score=80.58 TRINITY_DN91437_c0_g1_i1:29-1420(+)